MRVAPDSGLPEMLPLVGRLSVLFPWRHPVKRWTVWVDGAAEPACRFLLRQPAEHALFLFSDHDYMYIESPSGSQYAWNSFRLSWETI
jgi:hypothetical protein